MDTDALRVLLAGLAFAGPHLLLGFPPLRPRLAAALGEQRFVALFALVAAAGLALLAVALAASDGGGAGPGARLPATVRGVLLAPGIAGLILAFAALRAYPRHPAALFRAGLMPPRGIEKVSRHGFFVGFGTFAGVHALLAHEAAPAIAFGVLATVCAIGALAQDRKLHARYGEGWHDYARQTSVLPGLALMQGRTRLLPGDRIGAAVIRAVVAVVVFAALHPLWALGHGAAFIAVLAAGGVVVSVRRLWIARRTDSASHRRSQDPASQDRPPPAATARDT